MQSAPSVYHHLWRVESALEMGHNPTHAAHAGEKHPLSEEGSLGSEHSFSLQRQLRGRLEFRKSLQSDIRRGAQAAKTEEGWEMKQLPGCKPKGLRSRTPEPLHHYRHLEFDHVGKEAGRPLQGPTKTVSGAGLLGPWSPHQDFRKTNSIQLARPRATPAPCLLGPEPTSTAGAHRRFPPTLPILVPDTPLSPSSPLPSLVLGRVRFSGSHLSPRL